MIIKFRLRKVSRNQALNWLRLNKITFPTFKESYIGDDLFNGWRFIAGIDGVMYFANCIDKGICEIEYLHQSIIGVE